MLRTIGISDIISYGISHTIYQKRIPFSFLYNYLFYHFVFFFKLNSLAFDQTSSFNL